MEETHEQHKLHGFMQCAIYLSVALEAAIFVYLKAPFWGFFYGPIEKLSHVVIYSHLLYSKLATLFLICLVSIGTLAKKKQELDPKLHILYRFLGKGWHGVNTCGRACALSNYSHTA